MNSFFSANFSRRRFLGGSGAILAGSAIPLFHPADAASEEVSDALQRRFPEIEKRVGGRLGAAITDTQSGRRWTYRADERFPMNSTFKAFACAAVLARVDAGKEDLERRVDIRKEDLANWSPVTEKRVGGRGMTIGELCEAASTMSDNTAANLLVDALGGPRGWTDFMRGIGDAVSRLDRKEPGLTQGTPGDPRDTTTPEAISASLRKLVFGDVLSAASREQFVKWLVDNRVGQPLLRAGLPADWRIGDRTGAGGHGTRGIVAVIWPPERQPVMAAVYVTETKVSLDERNAAIAEIGRLLAQTLRS
ncbi:class A beta-lactamase [Nitratireductor sp. ZSWI3]|uniref:class A beta-lactamase n=1 Tax=Nitratireductor sp. ZSWI3 TaxID=2966359 RepID=UPI00214F6C5B|nr:class A beta-lactamase [Nitratireductor sp. ZSWI3]MCR4265774.1 class A beta-lactamase [Nitratireductor sp. ZSWI3]